MKGDGPQAPDGSGLDEDSYVQRIEEEFRRLRGRPLLLSPEDFQRALTWRQAGIPLFVVFGALEDVFRKASGRRPRRTPMTLAYCEPAVEEAFAHYKDRQGGGGTTARPSSPSLADAIENAALAVERSTAPAAARDAAAAALRGLLAGSAPQAGADVVAALAENLVAACLAALDPESRAAVEDSACRDIAPHARDMTLRVRERARAAAVARHVRRLFGLPDLNLLPLL